MAILVDEARWQWRGQRWAHLISDLTLDELHGFARRLGLRYLSYQGDHYDLPAARRDDALALGAVPVASREIVRRLHAAGLRRRGGKQATAWRRVGGLAGRGFDRSGLTRLLRPLAGEGTDAIVDTSRAVLAQVAADEVVVLHRPGEVVVLAVGGDLEADVPPVGDRPGLLLVNDTAERGRRHVEVVFRVDGAP